MTLLKASKTSNHMVLIVGALADKAEAIGPILKEMGLKFVHEKTADAGLERIKASQTPFSLAICDQRMPGMKGTQFLARVKEMAPDTIRLLVTGYSEMDTIIAAVNKGAVQHYISKPWHPEKLAEAIDAGIRHYEHHLDSKQLFALAKQQNGKLYELNCELVEITKHHEKESDTLSTYIAAIKDRLRQKTARRPLGPEQMQKRILKYLNDGEKDRQAALNTLYHETVTALYGAFTELAMRNGIEMPQGGEDG